jgi:hypothetical protein
MTVHLAVGNTRRVTVAYGTIVNPGLRELSGTILSVIGPADAPTAIVVPSKRVAKMGIVVSRRPSTQLPNGLFHRVTAVNGTGTRATLSLSAVLITDMVPVLSYDGPLAGQFKLRAAPNAADTFSVGLEIGACSFDAGRLEKFSHLPRISNFRPNLDINLAPWRGEVRANLTASFRVSVGFEVITSQALGCELKARVFNAVTVIPVGPVFVPVYFSVPLGGKFSFEGATSVKREFAFDATVGMRTKRQGATLVPYGVWERSAVNVTTTRTETATFKLSAFVGAEFGLGLPDIGNIKVALRARQGSMSPC